MKFGRFEPYIEEQESHFKNGYGASVIRDPRSYGQPNKLFELAVLKQNNQHPLCWDITYGTPITSNVLVNLGYDDVVKYLEDISNLK
jgi:hypothetical protein